MGDELTRMKVLVLGGSTGWIGQQLCALLAGKGIEHQPGKSRIENRESLSAELDSYAPTHVINAAGVTGRPNVDWCESNRQTTVRTNVLGTLTVADLCDQKGIHHTLLATGCIFEYDDAHPMGSGIGFKEEDKANFDGSWYSETKGYAEPMLECFSTTLILRLRMPISDDLNHRNFTTKILKYERVVDIPNSMTVLHEMIPAILAVAEKNLTGVLNFTNPGVISHNEVLQMYKEEVDPEYTWTNFTIEEQNKILASKRSNNELDSTKMLAALEGTGCAVNEIHDAMRGVMKRMKINLSAAGDNWMESLPRH